MASKSLSWDDLPDDSKFVYEALAKLGFSDFSTLNVTDQSLCLALAIHLKNSSRRDLWESQMERIQKRILIGLTASDLEVLAKLQTLTGLGASHIVRFALRALLQRIEGPTDRAV